MLDDPRYAHVDGNADRRKRADGERKANSAALAWERECPGGRLVTDETGQVYSGWNVHQYGDGRGWLWDCTLVGPRVPVGPFHAVRHFDMLALDAVTHVLNGDGRGDSPASSWLIHLADRQIPLRPAGWNERPDLARDQRQVLRMQWSELLGEPQPHWIPAFRSGTNQRNADAAWWAARLSNVFWLSGLAVRHELEAADRDRPRSSSGQPDQPARPPRGRGAPVQFDAENDRRLLAQWNEAKSKGTSAIDFETERGLEPGTLERTAARERSRRPKAK
jgi:hypothetical protein